MVDRFISLCGSISFKTTRQDCALAVRIIGYISKNPTIKFLAPLTGTDLSRYRYAVVTQ